MNRIFGKKALLLAAGILVGLPLGVAQLHADQGPAGAIRASSSTEPASTQPGKTREQVKEENTRRVVEFLKVNQPYAYDQAISLQKSDPARFDWMVSHAIGTVRSLENLQKRNKPLFDMKLKDYEITFQLYALRDQLKKPDITPAQKESLIKQLNDKLNQQFENGQKIRAIEIESLQKELAGCQQKLVDRAATKDEWIKKQMDDLIGNIPLTEK
ncbi:MAG: hypothetical protein ACTHN5_10010 [Phycisphaerae bacterium]